VSTTLFDLSSRTALVTGGSKGLGKAMARALPKAGASVAISSRHEDEPEIPPPLTADMMHRGEVKGWPSGRLRRSARSI
jgi:NAD(P)-dependent dehydrogenase (short-subunit alcohol dehydrogenase family)